MVWNEVLHREIPQGWKVEPLEKCISSSKNGEWGSAQAEHDDDIAVNCFRGADFKSITDEYLFTAPVRFVNSASKEKFLSDGDLVTEISGGSPTQSTGRIGYINEMFLKRGDKPMVCSNFCKAFTPKRREMQFWLYQTWKSHYEIGAMFNFESKTTGIKNLMFDLFVQSVSLPVPPTELLQKYQSIVAELYSSSQRVLMESTELASLRDFLLPMLMNGQVTIREPEHANP